MQFCGLIKNNKSSIQTINIPRKAKYVWFYDSRSYPSYGFDYSYIIELDSYGNGTQEAGFEIWGIKVENYEMRIPANLGGNPDNALLVLSQYSTQGHRQLNMTFPIMVNFKMKVR